jgi:hypothetical protein
MNIRVRPCALVRYVYAVCTLFLSVGAGYLWTRYWLLFNTDEALLLKSVRALLYASIFTWGLAVSRAR